MIHDKRKVTIVMELDFEASHLVPWRDFKEYCEYRLNLGLGTHKLVELKNMKVLDGEDLFLFQENKG